MYKVSIIYHKYPRFEISCIKNLDLTIGRIIVFRLHTFFLVIFVLMLKLYSILTFTT